jgi:hypothetical protein
LTAVHRQYARLEGFDQVADAAEAWDVDFRLLGNGNGNGNEAKVIKGPISTGVIGP